MCEVSSVGEDYSTYFGGAPEERESEESELHKAIFKDSRATHHSWANRQIEPMNRNIGGTVGAKKENDGSTSVAGEVHFSAKDNDGNKVSVTAEAKVNSDYEGKINTSGQVEISYDKDF